MKVLDKILEVESEIDAISDKINQLIKQKEEKQLIIYHLYSEITSVEELAYVLSQQVPRYYSVYFTNSGDPTELLGTMTINEHTVTVRVSYNYEYIDIVGLNKKDQALFASIYNY